ncbi:MAG TPA: aromatic amino acid transaminase, partial [Pirellulaceae bacterium]
MFEQVHSAKPDPILGLLEIFREDHRPNKVNLTVGVYQDEQGRTPILATVKRAEAMLLECETTKEYLGMAGRSDLGRLVPELVWGQRPDHPWGLATATLQTPGGSGALRVVADFLHGATPEATVWLSDPTWPNHPGIFQAAGMRSRTYRYLARESNELDFEGMLADLSCARAGDAVVLHGCCHNPTGVDLSVDEWSTIALLVSEKGLVPIVDFAYQGYAQGITEDGAGLRELSQAVTELFVCVSFSKTFGLYRERAGALIAAGRQASTVASVESRLKLCVRTNYSNPPSHGGSIVATILADRDLRTAWEHEVAGMRHRVAAMRHQFAECLASLGA